MRTLLKIWAIGTVSIACALPARSEQYTFKGGYPDPQTIQKAYDAADLNRAIEAYKFFYPTVSGEAIFEGNLQIGLKVNKAFGTLDTKPKHVGYTLNSDTPYAPLLIDLSGGPMTVDIPAGPADCGRHGRQPALGRRHGPARTGCWQRWQAPAVAAGL